MNYQITIVKTEPNPDYKDQMAKYRKDNTMFDRGYNMDRGEPLREFVKDVLMCELTEDQYKTVKAEILKAFE